MFLRDQCLWREREASGLGRGIHWTVTQAGQSLHHPVVDLWRVPQRPHSGGTQLGSCLIGNLIQTAPDVVTLKEAVPHGCCICWHHSRWLETFLEGRSAFDGDVYLWCFVLTAPGYIPLGPVKASTGRPGMVCRKSSLTFRLTFKIWWRRPAKAMLRPWAMSPMGRLHQQTW